MPAKSSRLGAGRKRFSRSTCFLKVHPILGPETPSFGEVLGNGRFLSNSAFNKAQESCLRYCFRRKELCCISVSDADKGEALELAREFRRLGFKIRTTEGTQQYPSRYGIECDKISKMSAGRPNIVRCN